MREEQKPADVAVPDVEMRAQAAPRIQRPYTLAEIKAKIASNDYSAELLLQHAMLLLEAQAAPQPPVAAQEPAAHDWRHSPSYGGEICASCGAAKGTRRGKAPCGEVSEKPSPIGYLYDWVSDDGVVRDWFSQDYDEAHSPTNQCHNIRPLYTHPAPHPAPVAQGDALDVEIAALESSCAHLGRLIDELRPDAERYQYLRERDLDTIRQGGVFAGRTPDNVVLNGDDLDAAIDAARAQTKEGGA